MRPLPPVLLLQPELLLHHAIVLLQQTERRFLQSGQVTVCGHSAYRRVEDGDEGGD